MSFFNETRLRGNERTNSELLQEAFMKARNRYSLSQFDKRRVSRMARDQFLAVNRYSRVIWNEALCEQLEAHLCCVDSINHNQPVYLVTLVDFHCATAVSGKDVDIDEIKRRLRVGLRGLSHIGIIEPAYYVNLQVGVRFQGKRCLFWHMHAVVWGISRKKLRLSLKKQEALGRFVAIAEGFRGTHAKKVKQGDLPKVIGYMLKSPGVAYRVSRMDLKQPDGEPLVNGDGEVLAKYFQRKAKLRKGERINLFHAMKHLTLDQLAVAGGEGCKLLANAKRIALSTQEEN
jgi:hypothetical protein